MAVGIFFSIFFGLIEGLTEFIPVSSTAHIILGGKFLELTPTPFFDVFVVFIQTGAILAAVVYFWKTVWKNKSLFGKVVVGFLPTAIVGLLFHSIFTSLFHGTTLIALMLILGGIALIFIRPIDTTVELQALSYKQAFLIGITQIAAFIPGVSRSGATLIGGTLLGIPRAHIVVFSFLLGVPTIIGAGIVELHTLPTLSPYEIQYLALGAVVSFVVALCTIRFFIQLLTKKPLAWFGWYRILVGVLVLFFL